MEKHQKHAKLNKPQIGNFHRNEWAILGTTCGKIKKLAFALSALLKEEYKLGYLDADHQGADAEAAAGRNSESAMAHGASREYTDKISFHQFNFEGHQDTYQFRVQFNNEDFVLVNGNHFQAKRQIVVIDPKKEPSLLKRLDQLTQVDLLLFDQGQEKPYPFLMEKFPNLKQVPSFALSDHEGIAGWMNTQLKAAKAPLFGLVLAGGKSIRMGQDKGALNFHGKAQRDHVAQLLDQCCEQVFLSGRSEQAFASDQAVIEDVFLGLGPFGGLLSAFKAFPDAAWLVVACDLPLLDTATLDQLVSARNPSQLATAFQSPLNEFPEPLITIWEPRSYPVLLQFLAQGFSCPRKVLINSAIELITAKNPQALTNVNDREDLDRVRTLLDNKA